MLIFWCNNMAIFRESGDAGENISEANGLVTIPEFDTIRGSFPNGAGDVDFYELELESNRRVNIEANTISNIIGDDGQAEEQLNPYDELALFNSQGEELSSTSDGDNTLSFTGDAGETFFLKLGRELGPDELTTPAIVDYEVTLDVSPDYPDFPEVDPGPYEEYVYGTDDNDTLTGEDNNGYFEGLGGDDLISGGGGADLIYGGTGRDSLKGNDGNDTIYGGKGRDILVGGKGSDILYDEGGDDIFYYSNVNQSLPGESKDSVGLDVGEDRIDLSLIDANLNDSGDQSFDLIGTSRFSGGSTGQVRYDASNDLIQVELGGDGDTIVDMEIASHKDFSSLSDSDFVF